MKRSLTLAAGLGAVMLLASGCGGGATQTPKSSGPSGSLSIAQGLFPETLNAELSTVQDTENVDSQINEPLMNYDYKTRQVTPWLALSWKSTNSTSWTLTLRKGVRFTNGEAFNAKEVAWNINWVLNPVNKAPLSTDLALVKSATATGPYTVKVTTKQPMPDLPTALTRLYVLPEKYFQKVGASGFASHPIGTGPYEFVGETNGQDVVLKANPHYWGPKPKIAKVTFYAISDDGQRANALTTGQVQIVNHLTPDLLPTLKSANANIKAIPSLRLMFIILDTTKPGPLQNKQVREALNYAVNKKAIVKDLLSGYGKLLQGQPLSPEYFGFDPNLQPYPYNPSLAKQMLTQAGYPPSSLHLNFYAPKGRYMADSEVAKAIANQLEQIGIHVNLQIFDWGTFINQFVQKKMGPMIFIGYSTQPDANFQLGINRCGQVYSYYCNKTFDSIINQADATINTQQRQALYEQADKIMHDDAPYIYLYQQYSLWGVSKTVHGFTPLPDGRIDLTGVSVH